LAFELRSEVVCLEERHEGGVTIVALARLDDRDPSERSLLHRREPVSVVELAQ
jgi:hypothetical protein